MNSDVNKLHTNTISLKQDDMTHEMACGLDIVPSGERVVTFFGSARMPATDPYYNSAIIMGANAAKAGFSVMTGGGPGVMEAAAKGAFQSGGKTYGINIILPNEQMMNEYITVPYTCKYLFIRKRLLIKHATAFVVFPGGIGTLDEFYEVITLIMINSVPRVPVVLFGSKFWGGLEKWMADTLLPSGYVSGDLFDLLTITDDEDEAIRIILEKVLK